MLTVWHDFTQTRSFLCDHSHSLCRWEVVLLGLGYCHAKGPPVLAEYKTAFIELICHLGELNGMPRSPLETEEENHWWLLTRTGSYAISFSGRSSRGHLHAFLSWSSETATNKKIPIIPVSLVRIFRHWLRNLNTSERGFCWLTFVKLMGQPKARSGRAPHRKRWNWGSPGSHPAPCTSPGRTVGREDRSPCASPLSPPKLWHKGVWSKGRDGKTHWVALVLSNTQATGLSTRFK